MRKLIAVAGIAFALSACSGAKVPQRFIGTWGSDCSKPFVRFERMGRIHVFPDGQDYRLKTAVFSGAYLIVSYRTPAKAEMTDTYLVSGDTLQLTKTVLNGLEANWNKQPMMRCIGPS